jgi:hypothetical protein
MSAFDALLAAAQADVRHSSIVVLLNQGVFAHRPACARVVAKKSPRPPRWVRWSGKSERTSRKQARQAVKIGRCRHQKRTSCS